MKKGKRAVLGILGVLPACAMWAFLAAGPVAVAGCGGDSTGPEQDVCNQVSFSQSGNVGIQMNCSGSVNSTISNIRYDDYSRPISYNFDFACGSERYTGAVSNIRWNNIGQALGATVLVNGKTCTF
ncbi:MAG TPA: hypothetical protein VLH75_09135 [Longimicrobiales bacterium]|nr:hypothetical protein [Longimicrobiales bacterium]